MRAIVEEGVGELGRLDISDSTPLRLRPTTGIDVAVALGYRPNLAARNLRSRTSRVVGLVSDAIAAEPYAGEMVRGVRHRESIAAPA